MNIAPMFDLVLLKPTNQEQKTEGGIILNVPKVQGGPVEAIIVAKGPGKFEDKDTWIPTVVEVGQKVMFLKHSATPMMVEAEEHFLIKESNILAEVK